MIAAIASESNNAKGRISSMGGRAPYYLIFEDGNLKEVVENPFARGGGGAGFAVPQMLAEKGVEVVVVGRIGPNMKATLAELGIRGVELEGTIKEGLEAIFG